MAAATNSNAGDGAARPLPHIAMFPFLSKGHATPLLHLAGLLLRRGLAAAVTFFTTPRNAPFVRAILAGTDVDVVELPFPSDHFPPSIPAGVESTDELPCMSLFLPFVAAVANLRPSLTTALNRLASKPDLLIADGFLAWTQAVADELGVPRVTSYGFGAFPFVVSRVVTAHKPHAHVSSVFEPFPVHGFPGHRFTKADLDPPFDEPDPAGAMWDFLIETRVATSASSGILVNRFRELEPAYLDRWNRDFGPRAWSVGPLCLAREPDQAPVMDWLDARRVMNRPVLYVAFGTQTKLRAAQSKEIAVGLDRSGLDFLWMLRANQFELEGDFEDRVRDRGKVVQGWVDQLGVLGHESVQGFVTHCGWNSTLESVCMGVPMVAWPMSGDQRLNAKFIVDELQIGLRIWPNDGTKDGPVKAEGLAKMARELINGEEGKRAAERLRKLAGTAQRAMDVGGSSYVNLQTMIQEVCGTRRAESNMISLETSDP